jgi:glycine/D-amino acid oxidase-like deaminating enzyme
MKRHHIVIGGGIVGVCVAYFLAARGRDVLLLEREELAAQFPVSSSGAPARMFRSAYGSDQRMTRLCTSSLEYWRYFEERSGSRRSSTFPVSTSPPPNRHQAGPGSIHHHQTDAAGLPRSTVG